ncbi:MAG: tetratricopeptide repeat protein, partial [Muribaculaceae bacterium]|nr:tetratricopeptide repeat protein [Muribaculaceae bacterium]
YFLDHGDDEKASRALFLQGIIQMNANRLGEAAVSFRKGLDIAHEGKYYMWEGQCARGLCMLYGELYSGSHQIEYAKHSYDSFLKTADKEWINYSKLNLARAFNNSCRYDESLSLIEELSNDAMVSNDSLMQLDLYHLRGLVSFNLGRYKEAVEYYKKAYELDSLILFPSDLQNIKISIHELPRDSLTPEISYFENNSQLKDESADAFLVLAELGNYKEAYESLLRYKNSQDSALYKIFSNNVSELLGQYEDQTAKLRQKEAKTERILWGCGLFVLVMVIGVSYWIYKKNLHQNELERRQLEMSMDILQSDLAAQVSDMNDMSLNIQLLNKENSRILTALQDMLYERYNKVNALCDAYYQDRLVESKRKKLAKEMEKLLKDFSDHAFLKEVGRYIDLCLDGLYSSFMEDFPDLSADSKRLFMFLTLGFSNRTICVILNLENPNLYNRKSRLKKIIAGSDAVRREDYLKNIR